MKTAVVIRHVAYEGLGLFNRVLELASYDVIYMDAGIADFSRKINIDADIMIVLGGPVSVNDMVKFPYLMDELQLIEYRLKNNLPVLGIGLGAHLMAKALGASIIPMHQSEYGWATIDLVSDSHLLQSLKEKRVLHWHHEMFSLPDGAELLASTSTSEVQAFSWEKSLALQFHAEIDIKKIEPWILGHAIEIQQLGDTHCLSDLRQGAEDYGTIMAEPAAQVMDKWLQSLITEPA
ncbi:MAG: gamma-glutamyl-gamma-aminobutyrate hydrolase family protein [Gammaproteobacteria bacterium]|nr:gamma-glutamyl-gamma-aminobutyrate hydrolase family protein [Gammaproteobacteria bacterium]